MKILITGCEGFSGKYISKFLLQQNFNFYGISRSNNDSFFDKTNFTRLNYSLDSDFKITDSFDAIVHTAATSPSKDIKNQKIVIDNVVGSLNLIKLIEDQKIKSEKFINFSSLSVLGNINTKLVSEKNLINSPDVYGSTKFIVEEILKELGTLTNSISFRLPAVVGYGASRHWLANIINKFKNHEDILYFNPEHKFNNVIHIHTLSKFIFHLLKKDRFFNNHDILNLSSIKPVPLKNLLNHIKYKLNSKSKLIVSPDKKESFRISCNYAIKNYQFVPMSTIDTVNKYISDLGKDF